MEPFDLSNTSDSVSHGGACLSRPSVEGSVKTPSTAPVTLLNPFEAIFTQNLTSITSVT